MQIVITTRPESEIKLTEDGITIKSFGTLEIFNVSRVEFPEAAEPKKPEKEPAAKPKTSSAEPSAKESRPRKALDIPKIKSLRAAGWTFAKIADEMGVAEQMVINQLRKYDQENQKAEALYDRLFLDDSQKED